MEKKRSIGVTLFSIGFMMIGAIILIYFFSLAYQFLDKTIKNYSLSRLISICFLLICYYFIPSLFHFMIAIGLFKLKPWVRVILFPFLPLSFIYIAYMLLLYLYTKSPSLPFGKNFYWVAIAIYLIFIVASFIFFTRPKVKEQFK